MQAEWHEFKLHSDRINLNSIPSKFSSLFGLELPHEPEGLLLNAIQPSVIRNIQTGSALLARVSYHRSDSLEFTPMYWAKWALLKVRSKQAQFELPDQ